MGKVDTERNYKDGRSLRETYRFWENGHKKFDLCIAVTSVKGLTKQWYESGVAFFLNYKDDKEDGMQKRGVKTRKLY
jgi:antitoxin component YwqK of YwqJK toxin-antitoxin module